MKALAVAAFIFLASTAPALAESPACRDTASLIDHLAATYTVLMPDTAIAPPAGGEPVMMPDVDASKKQYVTAASGIVANCKAHDPDTLYVLAVLSAWDTWIQRYSDMDTKSAEHSLQVLTECESNYYGTEKSATCSVWAHRAATWEVQMEEALGSP